MTSRSRTVVATTTWNTGALVDDFLDHYRRLGAAAVLLMDFGSVDGTRERVGAWGDFVEVFDLPSLAGKDSSNALLAEAKRRYPKEWWCLFCDPDEFLVTPRMQIDDASAAALPDAGTIVVERRNMTGPRSIATAQADLSPLRGLTLRIDGRHERTNQEMLDHERRLEPPWIYTAVPGKVLVRLGAADSIGDGDHVAITAAATVTAAPSDAYLLHYPFRDYREFASEGGARSTGLRGERVPRWICLAVPPLVAMSGATSTRARVPRAVRTRRTSPSANCGRCRH